MLENITEGTVVVIIEDQIDKRLAEYKKLSKIAKVTEFKQLTSKEMVNYVIQILGKYNLKISNLDAEYFVDSCGIDKQNNINELQKLVVSSKAQNVITKDMIDKICVKTFNAKLFDMLNNIVNKNKVEAIGQLEQLLMLKESIVKIYVMLYRQIFQIYMIKLFKSSNKITKDIASALGIHPYAFKTLSISAEKYTLDELKNILYMFDKYDEKTKFGDMDFEIGLKKIICNM